MLGSVSERLTPVRYHLPLRSAGGSRLPQIAKRDDLSRPRVRLSREKRKRTETYAESMFWSITLGLLSSIVLLMVRDRIFYLQPPLILILHEH